MYLDDSSIWETVQVISSINTDIMFPNLNRAKYIEVDYHSSSFLLALAFLSWESAARMPSIVLKLFSRRGFGAGLKPEQKISPQIPH